MASIVLLRTAARPHLGTPAARGGNQALQEGTGHRSRTDIDRTARHTCQSRSRLALRARPRRLQPVVACAACACSANKAIRTRASAHAWPRGAFRRPGGVKRVRAREMADRIFRVDKSSARPWKEAANGLSSGKRGLPYLEGGTPGLGCVPPDLRALRAAPIHSGLGMPPMHA